jgi:hypothetical protein
VNESDESVGEWLTLPDVAEVLGIDVMKVRRLIQERDLIAIRRGDPLRLSVPAALVAGGQLLPNLRGTLSVLTDGGFSDAEAITWLFTADPTLPGTPVEALWAGRRAEIRRRAQALAV